jgi:hypothetical protein
MARLLFTSASGFVAAAIRWITGSAVSHVGIQLDEDTIVHADRGGVQLDDLAGFLKGNGAGRTLRHVYELRADVALDPAEVKGYLGQKYDYDGMLWALVPTLSWRWFKLRLSNPLADRGEFWCSELATTALRKATQDAIPELRGLDAETLSPGMLLRRVSRGKSFAKVLLPKTKK